MLEAELETSVRADSSENATLKIYSPGPLGLTETLRTLEHLALPVCEEMAIPIVLPEGRTDLPSSDCASRRPPDDHRAPWSTARIGCAPRCARCRKDARPTIR